MDELGICACMKQDHGKIAHQLDKAQSSLGVDPLQFEKDFDKLHWLLENHFIIEESAIFQHLDQETSEVFVNMQRLIKEHEEIKNLQATILQAIATGDEPDFDTFAFALEKHKEFEDETFYPQLEEQLSEDKKKEIVDRMRQPLSVG